jgi:hypothetical protein
VSDAGSPVTDRRVALIANTSFSVGRPEFLAFDGGWSS